MFNPLRVAWTVFLVDKEGFPVGMPMLYAVAFAAASFLLGVLYERRLIARGYHPAPKRNEAGHTPEDATGLAARVR